MKKLFIILFIIPTMCWGQKADTIDMYQVMKILSKSGTISTGTPTTSVTLITKANGLSITKQDSLPAGTFGTYATGVHTGTAIYGVYYGAMKQDTIPVMMLVCDTTYVYGFSTTYSSRTPLLYHGSKSYEIENRLSYVWWQFGYYTNSFTRMAAMLPPEYLDQNKNPLPKSIVVFLTKEIK